MFSVGFAVLRNLFGRAYIKLNATEEPASWGRRFRRATHDEPKRDQKEVMLKGKDDNEVIGMPKAAAP